MAGGATAAAEGASAIHARATSLMGASEAALSDKSGVTTKDAHHVVADFRADRPRSGAGKHNNEVKGVWEGQEPDLPFAVSGNFFDAQFLSVK